MDCGPTGETSGRSNSHYGAAVRDRVRHLVRQEAECCAFLTFAIDESADQVTVTITVPERAGERADEALAPFLPSGAADSEHQVGRSLSGGTGCCQ
jgi:hypothetical protein